MLLKHNVSMSGLSFYKILNIYLKTLSWLIQREAIDTRKSNLASYTKLPLIVFVFYKDVLTSVCLLECCDIRRLKVTKYVIISVLDMYSTYVSIYIYKVFCVPQSVT